MESSTRRIDRGEGIFLFFVLLAWAGMFVHNRAELPDLPLLSPDSLLPTLIYAIMAAGWIKQAASRTTWNWLLLIWTSLHFVLGAWLSVLPLPIWPFSPEQSFGHYLVHMIYGLAQIPLLWKLIGEQSQLGRSNHGRL